MTSETPILIGSHFVEPEEIERGVRLILRAQALLATHQEYCANSPMGAALRDTRIRLTALRELLEAGLGEEVAE